MAFLVHELHPSVVHAPIALLPTAALVDALVASKPDRRLDRLGAGLWWAVSATGLVAGLSGMAASQEVRAEEPRARRRMMLHGLGNGVVLTAAVGIAGWRTARRASWGTAALGLAATALAGVTAYLGGEMVYSDGIGVKPLDPESPQGVGDSPALLSAAGLGSLVRDAGRGAAWLLRSAGEVFRDGALNRQALLPEP